MENLSFNYLTFNATTGIAAIALIILFLIARKVRQPAQLTRTDVKLQASQYHRSTSVRQQTATIYSVGRFMFGTYLIVIMTFLANYTLAPITNTLCSPNNESAMLGFILGLVFVCITMGTLMLTTQTKFQRDNGEAFEKVGGLGIVTKIIIWGILIFCVYMHIDASKFC